MTDQGIDTVVWSGGADSTLALTMKARNTTEQWPVRALTVAAHPQIDKHHLANERAAMKRYLTWAKRRGYHIEHHVVEVDFSGRLGIRHDSSGGQALVWLSHLAPYFQPNADVHFGYIRDDDFWHHRHRFERAFDALAALDGATWTLKFPIEWSRKVDVLGELCNLSVPNSCWWTCDGISKGKRPCRYCGKCKELARAREDIAKAEKFEGKLRVGKEAMDKVAVKKR